MQPLLQLWDQRVKNQRVQTVLKYNDELKLIYNYDNYIGFVKDNEKVINYIHHCVTKVEKVLFLKRCKFLFFIVMVKKKDDLELVKKAARLLKGETLTKEQNNLYTLHAKRKNRIKRLKMYVQKKNQQWSIDLADLNELSGYNNQYRYILVCVDVATRYAL